MLNRKEYNATFKTKLTQEQFDEIMGKPVSDISDIEELVLADKKGNAWYFLPKEKAIPKKWIQEYIWGADTHEEKQALRKMYAVWEEEQASLFEKQITEECTFAKRFADWEKENE